VNIIGEHIDYNGGRVLPCAISRGTWLLVRRNTDKKLRFQCLNFPEIAEFNLQTSYTKTGKEWFNYPLGVINQVLEEGSAISGLDMLFYGDLPIGAGLSSSASIEVLMGFALSELFGLGISRTDLALLSKKVENEFIGMNCGIMDQFAVAMGKKDNAILLDCDSLQYEYLPFETGDFDLVIINSNKQRSLTDSKYNERFAECGTSLKRLKQKLEIQNLCDITPEELEANLFLIGDPVLEKRTLHVVTENQRVKSAAVALRHHELNTLGELMYASHDSLRDLYEVSGRELDTIVEFAREFNNCIGARMTGAGFGGCAIALVKRDDIEEFGAMLREFYRSRVGYEPDVFSSPAGEGVGFI
jgi:galactokinase